MQLRAVDITPENFAPFGQVWSHLRPLLSCTATMHCMFQLPRRCRGSPAASRLLPWAAPTCCPGLQLVGATDDGKEFDEEDAQLQLDQGQPRWVGGWCV